MPILHIGITRNTDIETWSCEVWKVTCSSVEYLMCASAQTFL